MVGGKITSSKYDKFSEELGNGNIDLVNDDIRAMLVNSGAYTPDFVNDEFLSDVPGGARIATMSTMLSGRTLVGPVFDIEDYTFPAVSGDEINGLLIYKNTGVESTSVLIAYLDNGSNMPLTPEGVDILIRWSNGENKVFRL